MTFASIIFFSALGAFAIAIVANALIAGRVIYLRSRRQAVGPFELWKVGTWIWPLMVLRSRDVADAPLRWMLRALQFGFVWGMLGMALAMANSWAHGS